MMMKKERNKGYLVVALEDKDGDAQGKGAQVLDQLLREAVGVALGERVEKVAAEEVEADAGVGWELFVVCCVWRGGAWRARARVGEFWVLCAYDARRRRRRGRRLLTCSRPPPAACPLPPPAAACCLPPPSQCITACAKRAL